MQVIQSFLPLCDPMAYTLHGILQPIILEWVAFPFSSGCSWPRNWTGVSCVAGRLFLYQVSFREALLVIRELKCIEITEKQPQSGNTTIIQYNFKYTQFYLSRQTPFIWHGKRDSLHMQTVTTALNIVLSDGRWGKWFIERVFLAWRSRKFRKCRSV